VVELGDHGVEQVYEVGPGSGALGAQLADAGLEIGQLGLVVVWFILDDAEVLEAGQVQLTQNNSKSMNKIRKMYVSKV